MARLDRLWQQPDDGDYGMNETSSPATADKSSFGPDTQHAERQSYKAQVNSVSLLSLKQLAQEMLPRSSHLRALILAEPDSLSREQAIAKLEVFSRLLYKELEF